MKSPSHNSSALPVRAKAVAERSRRWMLDEAFPFWAERARARNGGFFERLDLAGRGIADEDSRVRLQARMAFTFALAADLGWDRSRSLELTERGLRVLVVDCRREDGLYGRTVRPGSGLVDASAETYDTAFALLAFATAYRVFGLDSALEAGTELSHAIDALLARDRHEGGYRERLPAPEIRDQNPHMHLTEASLAWYEATADEAALKRARAIIAFVEERFFDRDSGLLLEFSGVDIAHNRCEAGHMFEWVWILGRLRELTGQTRQDFIDRLYAGGMRLLHGLDYFPLSQHPDGSVREAKQRTWGPTEKLKAHITQWRSEPSSKLAALIVNTGEGLFRDHVDGALPGAWMDVIDPSGKPLACDITPATGYHIFLACQELIAFADALEAQ